MSVYLLSVCTHRISRHFFREHATDVIETMKAVTLSILAAMVLIATVASAYNDVMLDDAENEIFLHRRDNGECDSKREVKDKCEKCAKETKSLMIYRMCCKNEEDGRAWCNAFLSTNH
uniref:Uncharacterized protein n=1 Tax=Strigamia maritima TaxID=126957 RepID=T1JI34_STRMM